MATTTQGLTYLLYYAIVFEGDLCVYRGTCGRSWSRGSNKLGYVNLCLCIVCHWYDSNEGKRLKGGKLRLKSTHRR